MTPINSVRSLSAGGEVEKGEAGCERERLFLSIFTPPPHRARAVPFVITPLHERQSAHAMAKRAMPSSLSPPARVDVGYQ